MNMHCLVKIILTLVIVSTDCCSVSRGAVRSLTTAIIEAGTIFGEMAILGQGMHDSYAEALTPRVLCLMSRHDVKRLLLLGDQRIALCITETMGRRLLEAERRLSDFAFKSLTQRIATLLVMLADREPPRFARWTRGPSRPEVPFTHEQLAEMVGTHRETATKVLNDLRGQGLIELKRGKVVLLDTNALLAMSSS